MSHAPETVKVLIQRLESLRQAGVTHLPKPKSKTPPPGAKQQPSEHRPSAPDSSRRGSTAERKPGGGELASGQSAIALAAEVLSKHDRDDVAARQASLDAVAQRVAACTRCAELVRNRTQTVFGVGNPMARLAFLGEAPGADEDRQGEPFVGAAGQLLNKILAACGLKRPDVYILNILRCRPPDNRAPLPVEAAACREYLDAQLAIIRPEFICCLGAVAAQNLLGTNTTIGRLRGLVHDHGGIKVVCTYHPAYLLRNPASKRQTWDDMQFLLREMGLPIPPRAGEQ
ncbi:MAG: uracil-DNA glycosylase [Planctomycetota bacterium]